MKKFMTFAIALGCLAFTSCNKGADSNKDEAADKAAQIVEVSDVDKAAQLVVDIENAAAEGNIGRVNELQAELEKLIEANKNNPDFETQVWEAYNKLKGVSVTSDNYEELENEYSEEMPDFEAAYNEEMQKLEDEYNKEMKRIEDEVNEAMEDAAAEYEELYNNLSL